MQLLEARPDVQIVLVPRERSSSAYALRYAGHPRIIVPTSVVDGLNLLYHSDLMVSGGGTMVREAAALRVPAVTIFKGKMGAVDRWLIEQGKMISLHRADEIQPLLKKRTITPLENSNGALKIIVETILRLLPRAQ